MKILKTLIFMLSAVVLIGCETMPKSDPAFAPVAPPQQPKPVYNTGSIYMASYDVRLFEDHIARRVGDLLTIRLNERTQAKKDADIDVSKNTDMTVEAPTLWGVASQTILGNSMETRLKANRKADGAGKANQSNTFTGDISVTVYDVLANGDLLIRGEKRMTLNQGSEYIRISGIVRPIDIGADNVVLSNKVANATIMYTGDGAVADASKLGWLNRILNHWIFPF
jgi:flagellar L-ring protein precursor FlgH